MSRTAIAIMAAGKGTRLKSKRPKVLHEIGGKPLLEHVIRAASQVVPPGQIVAIIGHDADQVRKAMQHTGVKFALQAEQRGTGHAVISAKEQLDGFDEILVLSGDPPLISPATIRALLDFHHQQRAAMTILTAVPRDASGYGRIQRASAKSPVVKAIIEQKALKGAQVKLGEINSGIYAFSAKELWGNVSKLTTKNVHG